MFYILRYCYNPNSASTNRMLGYLKALDEKGISSTVVFLHPNKQYSIVQNHYSNIKIEYFWHKWMVYSKPFTRLTLNRYINRFLKRLKKGDAVYSYSVNKLIYAVQTVPGVRTYAEITEHPKASPGWEHPLLKLSPEQYEQTILKLDNLFVISRPLKDFFVEMGRTPESVTIVNMFVDKERFHRIQKEKGEKQYIAYCGTATNTKDGVDRLIKAFGLIAHKFPALHLLIIGKTPNHKESNYNFKLAKELNIQEQVVFTGVVETSKIPQILKDANILALARPNNIQAQYGFPTKLGEYLSTENPVVVTNVGTITDYLQDGESAMIAKPDDIEDFANKLDYLLSHPHEGKEIGKKGAIIADKYFNYKIETEKLIKAIGL